MYASVHDQPPPSLLSHPVTSAPAKAASGSVVKQLPTSAFFIPSSPHRLPSPSFASSLPPTRPLSRSEPSQKPIRFATRTPPGRSSRPTAAYAQMQRSPYSRETTDISDQELRQILESENISGLPAPYCLVPHYDGQMPLPPNTLWQQPVTAQGAGVSHGNTGGRGTSNAVSSSSTVEATSSGNVGAQRTSVSASGETTRRRTRTTLTPYQLRVLFRVWERTQYPSSDLRFRLATNLMMTPRNVQIWFQNQRQKTKERAEMRRRTHSPSSHTATMPGAIAPRPPARSFQNLQLSPSSTHILDAQGYSSHTGGMNIPGMSPPDSPFRYTHGPPPPPPAIPAPSLQHMSASLVSARHALHHNDMAHQSGTLPSQTSSPVAGTFVVASPVMLHSQTFSQQPHMPGQRHSHPYHSQPQHGSQPLTLPPSSHAYTPRALQNPHHQRHASQPHTLHYERKNMSVPDRISDDRSSMTRKGPEVMQPARMPPRAALSFMAEQHRARLRSTPSPLSSPLNQYSASLAPSMSSLSVDSLAAPLRITGPDNSVGNRGVQLAEILNPILPVAAPATTRANDDSEGMHVVMADTVNNTARVSSGSTDNQLGPLPSLGTVLANVQSTASSANTPKDSCAPAPSSSAVLEVSAATATDEKWRPW
ncbi:hypothetical protein COEREDRAFT_79282 [Coemansia reversa NRRL 1564]|uniref:Homeobox domain-containing protein n=1 Tax=Coemansia reversa (strain ATCC 12441 / NRRL 1564) TaxID=763665 RepID=A0A2G5BK23_COERN|nr:hypothetical protein COEREDRAFT_79282 [Coemansia reversa NRRL 1564]|eukprot:PIA19349.1 hypothetical protein COEREDRAFT_79282 [Coemansia reversa NRRL 1564]